MTFEFTLLSVPFVFAILCLCILAYYLYQLRDERIAQALILWMIPFFIWSVAVIVRLSATDFGTEVFWYRIRFIGPSFSAVGYLLLAAAYTSRDRWYTPKLLFAVSIIPVLTNLLVWTNAAHGLVGQPVMSSDPHPFVMTFDLGPWFVVHGVYSYALIGVGTYWLLLKFVDLHRRGLYRVQVTTILVAMVATMAVNFLYNIGVTTIDWTPVGGAISALILIVAMFQYRLVDVSPIAREIAVENMDSGMIVLDEAEQIVDVNSKAETVFEAEIETIVGQPISELTTESDGAIDHIFSVEDSETVSAAVDGESRYYDVTVSAITDATDETIGTVITFSDVSQEVQQSQDLQAQKENLERKNQRLEQFASVISHDIRNPLSIAQTYLDFARETKAEDDFAAVEEAHDRIESLLDEILTMARAETSVEDAESIQLSVVAEDAWQAAETGDVTLDNNFSDDGTVHGDPALVGILFENLYRRLIVQNNKAATIQAGPLESNQGFYIADDGTGVSATLPENIPENELGGNSENIGIGLAIAQELVIAHGWSITQTEAGDGGTRFEITTT